MHLHISSGCISNWIASIIATLANQPYVHRREAYCHGVPQRVKKALGQNIQANYN